MLLDVKLMRVQDNALERKKNLVRFLFFIFIFSLGGDVGSGSKEKVSKRQVTRKRQTDTEEAHSQSKKIFMVRTFKMNM